MEDIYGEELTEVPPLIKLKFQNDTGKSWAETTFDEREEYLVDWQIKRGEDIIDEKNSAKEIEADKKEQGRNASKKARLKRERERALFAKEKAKMEEKKAEDKKKRALVKKREDAMRMLKKEQAVRRRDNRD